MRVVDGVDVGDPDAVGPPELRVWSRVPGAPDDLATSQALLAYASDGFLIGTAMRPHAGIGQAMAHRRSPPPCSPRPSRSTSASTPASGCCSTTAAAMPAGAAPTARPEVFTADGRLVASFSQDNVIRTSPPARHRPTGSDRSRNLAARVIVTQLRYADAWSESSSAARNGPTTSPSSSPPCRRRGASDHLGELDAARRQSRVAWPRWASPLGARLALGLRNSPELVATVLAAWKLGRRAGAGALGPPGLGARHVCSRSSTPTVHLDAASIAWLDETTELDAHAAARRPVSPQTHGICSSGSTGTPKVILIDRPGRWDDETVGQPFPHSWAEVARPQMILVPSPLYHTNGFATMLSPDRRRPARAAREVRRRPRRRPRSSATGSRRSRRTPTMLQRIAALPDIDRPRPLQHRVGPAGRGGDRPVARAALVRPDRRRALLHGLRHDRGPRASPPSAATSGSRIRAASAAGYRDTEIRILGPDGDDAAARRDRRDLPAVADERALPLPRRRRAPADDGRRVRHRRRPRVRSTTTASSTSSTAGST